MSQQDNFDWIPFYKELATKLVAYRDRQKELIDFLEQLRSQGFTITRFEDQDQNGRRFPLSEIDPFTFFGSFNRGIVNEMRVRILDAVKSRFGVTAQVPRAFSGIPTLNNQNSWFFRVRTPQVVSIGLNSSRLVTLAIRMLLGVTRYEPQQVATQTRRTVYPVRIYICCKEES